jgi:hypothetical protein
MENRHQPREAKLYLQGIIRIIQVTISPYSKGRLLNEFE